MKASHVVRAAIGNGASCHAEKAAMLAKALFTDAR